MRFTLWVLFGSLCFAIAAQAVAIKALQHELLQTVDCSPDTVYK